MRLSRSLKGRKHCSGELRTTLSLARLLVARNRHREAKQILAPVCDRFTEGFDTPDFRAAKAFLDELRG